RLPLGRTVERVHVVGVVPAEGENQLHVSFGNGVHRRRLTGLRDQCGGGDDQKDAGNLGNLHDPVILARRPSHRRTLSAKRAKVAKKNVGWPRFGRIRSISASAAAAASARSRRRTAA